MTLNKASYDEERKENIFNLAVPENSSRPTWLSIFHSDKQVAWLIESLENWKRTTFGPLFFSFLLVVLGVCEYVCWSVHVATCLCLWVCLERVRVCALFFSCFFSFLDAVHNGGRRKSLPHAQSIRIGMQTKAHTGYLSKQSHKGSCSGLAQIHMLGVGWSQG